MIFPKHYQKKEIRKKFRRYRILFFSGMGVFFACLLAEVFLYGSGERLLKEAGKLPRDFFSRLFTVEGVTILCAFLLGVTLYAPFFQFFALGVRGIFSGYILSSLVLFSGSWENVLLFFLTLVYLISSSFLFCGYTSFCSAVSLRIFTDSTLKKYQIDEKTMFGGTLFNSTFFCNTVNLRFLFSYTLIFLAVFLFCGAQTMAYAFFRSLFI